MSRCYCRYFAFCLYSVILFSSANSATLTTVLDYEENQDYTKLDSDITTESVLALEKDTTFTTSEPDSVASILEFNSGTNENMGMETTTGASVNSEKDIVDDAVKGSNMTVLIVGLLFAMTMIVKGVPVIIAYAIPYCTNSPITGPGDFEDHQNKKKDTDANSDITSPEKDVQAGEDNDKDDLKEIKIICDPETSIINIRVHEIIPETHTTHLKSTEKII